jgi:hypothetical protein
MSWLKPEFFDIFGAVGFAYIIGLSAWALAAKKKITWWALTILFFVGILGFLVDIAIVYFSYF